MRHRAAAAIGFLAAGVLAGCQVPGKPLQPGDKVPAFVADNLDGGTFDGSSLHGAPYMLNIWATWCAPCRHEMPELQRLHDAFSGQGFQVVGVSVDDRGAAEVIQSFRDEIGVTFPIYHDPSWDIADKYGLIGLPGTFLVDAEGRFVRRWTGGFEPMAPEVQDGVREMIAAGD